MGSSDRRKPNDRREEQERRRRAAEQTRKFSDARRRGAEASRHLGEMPPRPQESEALHGTLAGVDLVVHAVEQVADVVGKTALAAGAEGVGGALLVGKLGYDFGHAWNQMSEGNEKALRMIGAQYGLNVIGQDARNPESPHIKEGKPYTLGEIRERTNRMDTGRFSYDKQTHGVGVKNLEAAVDTGLADVRDRANQLLSALKTPAERQEGMKALNSYQQQIEQSRLQRGEEMMRQKQQHQPAPGQGGQ